MKDSMMLPYYFWTILPKNIELKTTRDKDGWTPFMIACQEGHKGVVKLLPERSDLLEIKIYDFSPEWKGLLNTQYSWKFNIMIYTSTRC